MSRIRLASEFPSRVPGLLTETAGLTPQEIAAAEEQEFFVRCGQAVQDMFQPGEPGFAQAKDLHWRLDPNFSLDNFLADSKAFFVETIDVFLAEDENPAYYRSMIRRLIQEPIIVHKSGGVHYVWDGIHRLGGSLKAGRTTIPAIIGEHTAEILAAKDEFIATPPRRRKP